MCKRATNTRLENDVYFIKVCFDIHCAIRKRTALECLQKYVLL